MLQPNYSTFADVRSNRLAEAARMAQRVGMGVELELPYLARTDPERRARYLRLSRRRGEVRLHGPFDPGLLPVDRSSAASLPLRPTPRSATSTTRRTVSSREPTGPGRRDDKGGSTDQTPCGSVLASIAAVGFASRLSWDYHGSIHVGRGYYPLSRLFMDRRPENYRPSDQRGFGQGKRAVFRAGWRP